MILRRVVYHILMNEEGQWLVMRDGECDPASAHDAREDALDAGKELACREKAKLVIHNPDGSIKRECTYGYKCWRCTD